MSGAGPDLHQIAKVLKSNGAEGEVLVGFRTFGPEDVNFKEPVFIEFDGMPVPFFFERFSRRGSSRACVRLTGVRSLADAEELVGKVVFVRPDAIHEYSHGEEGLDPEALSGWTLRDADGSEVGVITGFEPIPGNPCLYEDTENGQVMVPLHEDLILSVDEDSATLTMRLPDGLHNPL